MQKPIKICESSLRRILGLRMRANQHKYRYELFSQYPEVMIDQHSSGSMMWSIIQAKKIDQIGLEKWLITSDAQGYRDQIKVFEPKEAIPIYPIMR
jgi:hypothetical protein